MRHVTEYCNVIGLHCTVRWDTACIYAVHQTFVEVGAGHAAIQHPAHMHISAPPLLATSAHSGILATID